MQKTLSRDEKQYGVLQWLRFIAQWLRFVPSQFDLNDNSLEEIWNGDMRCSTTLLTSGEYTFYAQASLPNGEKIYSNIKGVIVQDLKVEMQDLVQERQSLMEISYKTGGIYASIESLDTMLANIDITPIQRVKYHQISGLSSQNYWWILMLFLSIEWYFRKKLGLL